VGKTNLYKPHEGLYFVIATENRVSTFMYSTTMVGEAPNLPQRLPIAQFIVIASNNENVGCLWGRLRAYSPRLNGIDSINL